MSPRVISNLSSTSSPVPSAGVSGTTGLCQDGAQLICSSVQGLHVPCSHRESCWNSEGCYPSKVCCDQVCISASLWLWTVTFTGAPPRKEPSFRWEGLELYLCALWLGSDTVIIIISYLTQDYIVTFVKGIRIIQGRFQNDVLTLPAGNTWDFSIFFSVETWWSLGLGPSTY